MTNRLQEQFPYGYNAGDNLTKRINNAPERCDETQKLFQPSYENKILVFSLNLSRCRCPNDGRRCHQ